MVVVFPRLLKASETLKFCVPHEIREKFLLLEQSDFDHYQSSFKTILLQFSGTLEIGYLTMQETNPTQMYVVD